MRYCPICASEAQKINTIYYKCCDCNFYFNPLKIDKNNIFEDFINLRKTTDTEDVVITLPNITEYHINNDLYPCLWSTDSVLEVLYRTKNLFTLVKQAEAVYVLKPINKRPTIYCGMIVKNEERDLAKCLKSIENIVDKIIILDTGSTDKTIEIAKQFKKVEIETYLDASKQDETGNWKLWDFSKARNAFVSKIDKEADYLLWMDADDKLLTPKVLQKSVYLDTPEIFGVQIESNYNIFTHYRLWKTKLGIKFIGKIHECPNYRDYNTQIIENCKIIHDAAPNSDEPATERNLRLLKAAYKEERKNPRTLFYLACAYKDVGDYENAIKYYKKRLKITKNSYSDEKLFAGLYKARCEKYLNKLTEAKQTILDIFTEKIPEWSEFNMELAEIDYKEGNYTESIVECNTALSNPISSTDLWREKDKYTNKPHELLSLCYEKLNNKQKALFHANEARDIIFKTTNMYDIDLENRIKKLSSKPKIALYRPGSIGDIIMTLQLIPLLKQRYPEHEIHYYCYYIIGDGLSYLMKASGIDKVIDFKEYKNNRENYDIFIDLVGYPINNGYPNKPMTKHLIEYFADEMGISYLLEDTLPKLIIQKPEINVIGKYITIHPQAGWSIYKNWSFANWEEIITHCPLPVYQIGSSSDYKLKGANHEFMGRSLFESIKLVANASFHMGVDSFTNHLTNIEWVGKGQTPAIILWGSTQMTASGYPKNCNISLNLPCQPCFKEDPNKSRMSGGVCNNPPNQIYDNPQHCCMMGITVEEVLIEVKKLLTLAIET